MKIAAGSGVMGLTLAWVGCSQAFVAPAGTGESPLFHETKTRHNSLIFPSLFMNTTKAGVCRLLWSRGGTGGRYNAYALEGSG